ncbi:ocellar opsin-like isoform X1 [Limulus polyphemus]|uniref:Ocellar opsin-like n=1 Tax=Limulus polyphemus TaxID=6850 RepID=A0A097J9F0_LIMPO|nr:ocellar opsin-like [Limulus polyphemus]XP_013774737.1 ocellar opsin-like isoform X1 [Limulus polyphemus]AIT75832.1 opsin 8 [Limulus polyphemus]
MLDIISSSSPFWWQFSSNASVVDMVPKDMLHMVHEHWYRFPSLNPLWFQILGVAMIFLGILCICGNGVVIYIFLTTKSMRTASNVLIVNLAFSDFMMMGTMMPMMATNCFAEKWALGPFMCEVYGMLGSLFGCASIWSMVMITYDRYHIIGKGFSVSPMTHSKAALMNIFVWAWSIGWTLAPFFGWNRYVPEGNMTSCTFDYLTKDTHSRSYVVIYATAVYFLPLFITIYCYFFIVRAVADHERSLREQAKKMNVTSLRANGDQQGARAEIRLAKIAMFNVGLWFVAWTPYLIIAFNGIFSDGTKLTPLATIWGSVFAKANSVYNPIVYGISHPKYRVALKAKLPWLFCDTDNDENFSNESNDTSTLITEKIQLPFKIST